MPWTHLDQADDPSAGVVGHHIAVGSGNAISIAEVVSIDQERLVHVRPMRGPVTSECLRNAHAGR